MKRSEFIKLLDERIEYVEWLNPVPHEDYTSSEIWNEPDTDGRLLDPEVEWEDSAHKKLCEELEILRELRNFYEDNQMSDQAEQLEMGR